ncbi:MAG: diaminopimelate epimerase [Gammaproteobacteria bacterium]|nr:MAG: diaminopimelate epimerase [Gammaproteobacteria bacterium]RLA54110.1 MAG: diaminopimelate epimerase [Gammaproteobacteria bacterium]
MIRFTKMHGLGNDFVVIDGVSQAIHMTPTLAQNLADRHRGVGCDQVLVVEPPSVANVDFRYRIFNADGSEVAQCGNGARCFAKFVVDQKLTGKKHIRVQTNTGILELQFENSKSISVAMGIPVFDPKHIPLLSDQQETCYPLKVDGAMYRVAALSLGNPHAVLQVDNVDNAPIAELGPKIESHSNFPERVNAGFMEVVSRRQIRLRVYERGVGETQACGSGACAAVVAGIQQDLLDSSVSVDLVGGRLDISWPGENQSVTMTGPATTVFHGRIKI